MKPYCYSHTIPNYNHAVYFASDEHCFKAKVGPRKTLYRIHVKMDGGYRTSGRAYPRKMVDGFIVVRGYAPLKRPYDIPMVYSSKQDWMK